MIKECEQNGWEFITGGFVDRIGPNGTFPKVHKYTDIWKVISKTLDFLDIQ